MLQAHVILPLAVAQTYTYAVPEHLAGDVAIGKRVAVQFGAKRVYSGIIKHLFDTDEPPQFALKPIINVLDAQPIVLPLQLKFWQWLSDYYLSAEGEVMLAALPTAMRLSSETKFTKNPTFNQDFSVLDDREYLIAEALSTHEEISIEDMRDILDLKNVFHVIKSLLEKGVILVKEELVERYKPKTVAVITLAEEFRDETALAALFAQLNRAPKQLELLMTYIHYSAISRQQYVEKRLLFEKIEGGDGAYKSLVSKGVFEEEQQAISRLKDEYNDDTLQYALSEEQQNTLNSIKQQFTEKSVVLVHGVTSSGKTQLYMKLMEEVIDSGKQALYLLPEIALTTQMISRLRRVFGNDIGIYHSRFSDQERVEIWQKVMSGQYRAVVGARSALFLPFKTLGLVVIDEEHDPSFKQHDPAPRYHARDSAIYLAALHGAKTLLGSATPSVESYFNAVKAKKYGLVTMTQRFGGVEPPEVEVVNLRKAQLEGNMKSHFSSVLLQEITTALQNGEQVIIFQNRRGYAPYITCDTCSWIPQCVQCDVALTYHKFANELRCHYCGYRRKLVSECDACGSTDLHMQGFGTEKIEDELQIYFPEAQIGRLDLEVARSKTGFERVIGEFEERKIQILVGTQMITKGLDFDNVRVVGIISADQLLNFPDFRAIERAFALMLQVSGRAGRREKRGKVIIQSHNPHQKVMDFVLNNDYNSFFVNEMYERMRYNYPPFSRIIHITIKHTDPDTVNAASFELAKALKNVFKEQLLGPTVPLVSRVRNYYLRQMMIKLDKNIGQLAQYKRFMREIIDKFQQQANRKSVIVQLDIDPY
jgi:primosomal protein N' (replication factor Y)